MTWASPDPSAPTGGPNPAPPPVAPAHQPPPYAPYAPYTAYAPMPSYAPPPLYPPAPSRGGMVWWAVLLIAGAALLLGVAAGAVIGAAFTSVESTQPAVVATAGPGGDLPPLASPPGTCMKAVLDFGFGFEDHPVKDVSHTVPCETPHDVELYAEVVAPVVDHAAYPEDGSLDYFADNACYLAFASYVGLHYDDSMYDYLPVIPSESAWRNGDRSVRCLLFDVDGSPLREPAQQSRR